VEGINEGSLVVEWVANVLLAVYNLNMGYPFATWGEMCFMSVQCGIQVVLFYKFTKQGKASEFNLVPKGLGFVFFVGVMLSYAAAPGAVSGGIGKANFDTSLVVFGSAPAVMTVIARLPQIFQNFRQGHTGQLSFVTWFMSMGGNAIRVVTTLGMAFDPVTLAGHVIALLCNLVLIGQILLMAGKTAEVMAKVDGKKKK